MQKSIQNKSLIFFIFCLCSTFGCYAQGDSTPKYSNEFLAIGVGARGLGMANAQVAVVNDVTSGYWNPAGLTKITADYEFSLMHASYFAGIANYDYAGFATPIDEKSFLGISLIRFGVDDIPDTRFLFDADGTLNYDNVRSFSAADYALLLTYASKVPKIEGLTAGANFKIIHRNVGVFANAWGFGIDLGIQYQKNNWQFGASARDVTGTYNVWAFNSETIQDVFTQTGNEVPESSTEITLPRLLLGIGHELTIKDKIGILWTLGADVTFDGKRNTLVKSDFASLDPQLGLELSYKDLLFVRGGVGGIQEIKDFDGSTSFTYQPNFGVGFKLGVVAIDYALTDIGDQSEALYSNVFSLKVSLNKKEKTNQ